MDEMTYDGLVNNSTPYHEYSAVNKLVSWVQQVLHFSFYCFVNNAPMRPLMINDYPPWRALSLVYDAVDQQASVPPTPPHIGALPRHHRPQNPRAAAAVGWHLHQDRDDHHHYGHRQCDK